jgi:phage terminase large subunit
LSILRVETGYSPRRHQAELHSLLRRFNVLVCHRRFGKTHFAINDKLDRALVLKRRDPQYAYIAPTYGQAERVAWDLIKHYTKNIPNVKTHESNLRLEIPRPALGDKIKILLMGAENPDAMRGMYFDGVTLDEYAEMNPIVWSQVVRPTLADRMGWATFIGTPKGMNHFYQMHMFAKHGNPEKGVPPSEQWFTKIYKASETGIIPISELEEMRSTMSEEEYAQELECSFSAALVGAYYGKQIEAAEKEGRITHLPYDPALPTYTAWDLGIDDTTAIWIFQTHRLNEIRCIDYIENAGVGLEWYIRQLQDRKYTYTEHLLPHDAAARELGTGKSREEVLRSTGLGAKTRIIPRQSVEDGINAARLCLSNSWFDQKKCLKGIEALKNYERAWDAKNKIFQSRPKHNWASHGSDAFRTLAMGVRHERSSGDRKRQSYAENTFSVL